MKSIIFAAFAGLAVFTGCGGSGVADPRAEYDVGIYLGPGAWDESIAAALQAVRTAEYSIVMLSDGDILDGGAIAARILLFPGGDPRDYWTALGAVGYENIRRFVESGGGYVGFGGGAAIAGSDSGIWRGIGIFDGDAAWPIDRIAPYPNFTLTDVGLADDAHPVGRGGASRYLTMYRWGPEFKGRDPQSTSVVYIYEVTGTPAVVTVEYGLGRAVLIGFQPEFEESSPRDSTDFGSNLADPDSEWDIIARALGYCIGL